MSQITPITACSRKVLEHLFIRLNIEDYIDMDDISNVADLARRIRDNKYDISATLGVTPARPLTVAQIMEWLEDNYVTDNQAKEIMEVTGYGHPAINTLTNGSLINEMKLTFFLEMINDISLGDLEALFQKARPGKVPVGQLSLVE